MPWLGNSYIRVGVCLLVLFRHVFIKDGEAMAKRAKTRRFRVELCVTKFTLAWYRCIKSQVK
jgi:hypothetical protein